MSNTELIAILKTLKTQASSLPQPFERLIRGLIVRNLDQTKKLLDAVEEKGLFDSHEKQFEEIKEKFKQEILPPLNEGAFHTDGWGFFDYLVKILDFAEELDRFFKSTGQFNFQDKDSEDKSSYINGSVPLFRALFNGELEVFNRYLEEGVETDGKDMFGGTLLHHIAILGGGEYFARLLIQNLTLKEYSKYLRSVNMSGQTPVQMAEALENTEVVEIFKSPISWATKHHDFSFITKMLVHEVPAVKQGLFKAP